jgi:hypothetical protein
MSKTGRRTWQQAEERAAALFACRRQPGSGSSGRDDVSSMSDSTHTVLYLESKLRDRHTARTLHDATKKKAMKEKKIPVLCLFDKNRPGALVVIHSDDLAVVLAEFAAALPDEERDRLEGLIRTAYARQRDGETA